MTSMRLFGVHFVLLTILFCTVAKSDTLELPRPTGDTVFGFMVEAPRYDITTTRQADRKLIEDQLQHLSNALDLLFAECLKDAKITPAQQRHRVFLYRDKVEYVASLKRVEPSIDQTNGLYHAPRKAAHFFSMEAKIMFHEGTHQILAERYFYEKKPVFRNNFWVVEGIALFMETLKIEDKYYKIGDILADRLYAAKYQFDRGYNLPIQKLAAMSSMETQSRSSEDLNKIYRQAATLTHWLMFAEEGYYRGALFELLRRTYRNEATPEALSELTGLSFEELDKKYEAFLETIPDDPSVP